MASLFRWLGDAANAVGQTVDNVVPGNQSFLHRPVQPPQPNQPAPAQVKLPTNIQPLANSINAVKIPGLGNYNVGNLYRDVAQPVVNSVQNTAKILAAPDAMAVQSAAQAAAKIGVPGAANIANQAQQFNRSNIGSIPYVQQAVTANRAGQPFVSTFRPVLGGVAQDVSNAAALYPLGGALELGAVGSAKLGVPEIARLAQTQGVKAATSAVAKDVGKSVVQNAAENLAPSIAAGTGQALSDPNSHGVNLAKDAAMNSLINEVLGTGVGTGAHVAGAAVGEAARGVKAVVTSPYLRNQNGYVAGTSAKGLDQALQNGKLQDPVHGNQPFYEVSDKGMSLRKSGIQTLNDSLSNGGSVPLSTVISHSKLSKDYPQIMDDTKVVIDRNIPRPSQFNYDTNTIHINDQNPANKTADGLKQSIIHETQHAIDNYEGMPRGTVIESKLSKADQQIYNKLNDHYQEVSNRVRANDMMLNEKRDALVRQGMSPQDAIIQTNDESMANPDRQLLDRLVQARNTVAARSVKPDANEVATNNYMNNLAEGRARTAENRMNLSQKQIDKAPIDGSFGIAPGQVADNIGQSGLAARENLPAIKENKFTQSVRNSPEVSSEVQGAVSGQHTVRNTKQLLEDVQSQIKTDGLEKATNDVLSKLAVKNGSADEQTLAKAIEIAKAHDALGTETGHDMATSLYDQVAEHAVQKGRDVQILSILARRSPEGLRNKAFRDLKKAGVEVTPEIKKEIQDHIDAIKSMPDGKAKDFAVAVLQKSVLKHVPQSKVGNLVSIWKAGLLSGVKTQGGNFVSNATIAGLKKASDLPATIADKAISLGTGQRTKTTTLKGALSGTKQGLGTAKTTLKNGIDLRSVGDKYEQHAEINLKNKFLQNVFGNPSNMVFRGMAAADQPFYYSALKNSLYDQAKADGINAGLKGKALREHMNKLVQDPSESMTNIAAAEADKAVLGHDTVASKLISAAKRGIANLPEDQFPPATKAIASTVVDVLAPFTKVPSAFLSRTVDFTPLGVGREVFTQIAKGKFDQRQLAQAIGEGATGTGLIAIGMALAQNGQLSGNFPSSDQKEQARWKAEGITPNSVKIDGQWISLNYLGQLGLLFNAGKQIVDTKDGNGIAAALGGLGQGLLGQSFLQGFTGFSDAIKNPQQNLDNYVRSQAASVVPSWLNDIANATDNLQRQSGSVADSIKAKIPGLRETLTPKFDVFGNDLTQAAGSGVQTAINPLKPSNSIDNPMYQELNRLAATDKSNAVFPVPSKAIGTGADAVKLNVEQQRERQQIVGNLLTPIWQKIMDSTQYKNMDDAHKKDALQRALTDVNTAADRQMLANIDPSKLTKPATASVSNILSGSQDSAGNYLTKAANKGVSTANMSPADRYQANLTKYKNDLAAGKLTALDKFTRTQALGKEAITSKYSQQVQDFYNMSKAQQAAYFKQDPTTASQLYDQAKQLDAELGNNNFAKGTKYKYGLGSKPKAAKKISTKIPNGSSINKLVSSRKVSMPKAPKAPKLAKVSVPKVPKVNVKSTLPKIPQVARAPQPPTRRKSVA